jgi:catechol 2,3-dioxygenase-like lactoylglutathione lyase family enzyme
MCVGGPPIRAQVSAPNAAQVSMGHLHFHVRDVTANRAFWVALGAKPARPLDGAEMVAFDGLLIMLSPGEPTGTTEGSVINHVALRVKSFAQVEAAGLKVERRRIEGRESGGVVAPSGDRVELFEENAEQVRFVLDAGQASVVAERHNRPLQAVVVPHHLHFDVPVGADATAQAWYVKTFGGVPGIRLRYKAADLPGMNLNFSGLPMPMTPTKGRTLDHIGFEVANLESFCRNLSAAGVKLDQPYSKGRDGVATASLTDPWGTSIELTEGLNHWR